MAGQTKAERRQTRADRKRRAAANGIEGRLARIEQAMASQSQRAEELLSRVTLASKALQAGERPPASAAKSSLDGAIVRDLEEALRLRRENTVAVDQPLALICQAQRSGGTLLGRLFDGHPQIHAHPHELHIGQRRPHTWPALPLDEGPETWFAKLQEEKLIQLFSKGRGKIPLKTAIENPDESAYPLMLPPALQRLVFLDEVARRSPIGSEREILDCYMTSLFNAWLDNQNLRGTDKRWVVAFSPRRAWGEGLRKLFKIYPDGRLISILRDPMSWYTSAQGRDPDADPETLLELWKRSAREMLEANRRYGERLCVVRFEQLVVDTDATMRRLADFLEIDFDPQLTVPTFNGYPVGANSSYEVRTTGIVTDPVERYKELLSSDQEELVKSQCEELYQEVLPLAERRVAATDKAAAKAPTRRATAKKPARGAAASAPKRRATSKDQKS